MAIRKVTGTACADPAPAAAPGDGTDTRTGDRLQPDDAGRRTTTAEEKTQEAGNGEKENEGEEKEEEEEKGDDEGCFSGVGAFFGCGGDQAKQAGEQHDGLVEDEGPGERHGVSGHRLSGRRRRDVGGTAGMSESGTAPNAEEMWDPQVARWRDPEGDYVLPHALRSLPQPWDEYDWSWIAELPRTDERLAEARRVVTVLLDDPGLAPHVPQPPSPGLLWHVWEEFHEAVVANMPRTSQVTWSGVDELVRAWQSRPQLYPLQQHVVQHVEAAMLAMIPSLRDDIADSVFRWLALDPDPGRFADWAVDLAERCVTEDIGADSAIELLGAMGGPEARAALERLSVKPVGPASWENAGAAQSMLFDRWSEGTSY